MADLKNSGKEAAPAVGPEVPARSRYVLITPARNEAEYIELTLQSVVQQTVRPLRWVIVSDGSTDGTDEKVKKYAAEHDWIQLLRMPERQERNFAGKVLAFNAGYAQVTPLDFEFVGNIDADISFEPDFFSFLLARLSENPRLGLVGAAFVEGESRYDYRFTSIEHVSGQCQLFRRACFESFNGYVPVKGGGIDVAAVLNARLHGWETRTFAERVFIHHRVMGSAVNKGLMVRFHDGEKDYRLGSHPLWELFRGVYQMAKQRPPVLGGLSILGGYVWSALRRVPRQIGPELVKLRRKEQMARLKAFFLPMFSNKSPKAQPTSAGAGQG
ncbi:MAG: glycosyltransferase family 2 protein [Verrucomicrobiota bacterium]|jgi:glycosyltransferase involved in cell wall biosynthesis